MFFLYFIFLIVVAIISFSHEGVFEIDEVHKSLTICPHHRDAYGLRWRSSKRNCIIPEIISGYKKSAKRIHGDRGVDFDQSEFLFDRCGFLVPVGSCKYKKSVFITLVRKSTVLSPWSIALVRFTQSVLSFQIYIQCIKTTKHCFLFTSSVHQIKSNSLTQHFYQRH